MARTVLLKGSIFSGLFAAMCLGSFAACSGGGDGGGTGGANGSGGTGGTGTTVADEPVPKVTGARILDPAVLPEGGLATHATNYCATLASGMSCRYKYFDSESPPSTAFERIAIGSDHGCGLDGAGAVTCWGAGQEVLAVGETDCSFDECGQAVAPTGTFIELTAEQTYTCGLDSSGAMSCWGLGVTALPGTFVDIDSSSNADNQRLCGLTKEGKILCDLGTPPTSSSPYTQLAVGSDVICGLRAGAIDCAGLDGKEGEFARVSAGLGFACALLVDGTPYCWGDGLRIRPPTGPLTELVAADDYACGRHQDGTVECWGEGQTGGVDSSQCGFGKTLLSGTLGGNAVTQDWMISAGTGYFEQTGFTFMVDLEQTPSDTNPGRFMLTGREDLGTEDIPRFALDNGQSVSLTSGMLWMPGGVTAPVYCTGPESTVKRVGDEAILDLKAMSLLGACPAGEPVDGQLLFCKGDFFDGCTTTVMDSGVISGKLGELTVPADARYSLMSGGETSALLSFNYGFMKWNLSADGSITNGIIFTDPASVFGGAVYCIGGGTSVQDGTSASDRLYTFTNLTKLGTCVGASGGDSLSGCLR